MDLGLKSRHRWAVLVFAFVVAGCRSQSSKTYSFAVVDGFPESTVLGSIASLTGSGYTYSANSEYFHVDASGTVLSKTAIWSIVLPSNPYSFIVLATSNSPPQSKAVFTVSVYVMVPKVQAPYFQQGSTANITVFGGGFLTQTFLLNASSPDTSSIAGSQIIYSIIAGNVDGLFRLSPAAILGKPVALLNVSSPLPSQAAYVLTVAARDGNTPPFTGYITIYVQILNPADYQPRLTNINSSVIQNNAPPQLPILQLRASVPLAGYTGGVLTYAIANNSLLAVDAGTGIVSVKGALSDGTYLNESLCSRLQCPSNIASCLAHCTIDAWAVNSLAAAPDQQLRDATRIVFDLVNVTDRLPTVNTVNTGPRSVNVSELAFLGTLITWVTVGDGDVDATVVAGDPTATFYLSCLFTDLAKVSVCQILLNGSLVHSITPSYDLLVRVRIRTLPLVYTSFSVFVTAAPLSLPVFGKSTYQATVDFLDSPGTVITTVQASGSQSGQVIYSFSAGSTIQSLFSVDSITGQVQLQLSFNASMSPGSMLAYSLLTVLNVSAQDSKIPSLVAYTQVSVNLITSGHVGVDCVTTSAMTTCSSSFTSVFYPSSFWASFAFPCGNIAAAAPNAGCLVASLSAPATRAFGPGTVVRYNLVSANSQFAVANLTGLVTASCPLPAPGSMHRLTVAVAPPGGSNYSLVSLLALVRDPLESAVTFDHPAGYSILVSRAKIAGAVPSSVKIAQVSASSLGPPTYFLADCEPERAFMVVASTGEIFSMLPGSRLLPAYSLRIIARGLTQMASVVVNVTVLDSEAPRFVGISGSTLTVSLPEDTAVGEVVYVVSATSLRDVSYALLFNDTISGVRFSLDNVTGVLRLMSCHNLKVGASFNLQVVAMDNSPQSLAAVVSINVTVTDVNSYTPTFSKSAYRLSVNESVSPNFTVAQLLAVDEDWGLNGLVSYQLDATRNTGGAFGILASGWLYVARPLDRERLAHYNLILTATDGGSPPRSSSASISVHVLDSNDNSPVYFMPSYSFIVVETLPVGVLVGTITASDADTGRNGRIIYTVAASSGATFFDLDPFSGVLQTSIFPTDREDIVGSTGSSVIILTIIASDEGVVP